MSLRTILCIGAPPADNPLEWINRSIDQEEDVQGHTELREAISALEARRVELEALIAKDLERRLFSASEEIAQIVTNPIPPPADDDEFRTGSTRCGSHFTMTWFAVSTS
jgi:hypothetical protein